MSRTLIRGGTVVSVEGTRRGDLLVDGERIAAIEAPGVVGSAAADRVIEADGLLLLPGVIDVHTHTRIPTADDPNRFYRDSVAAAHGGTTTFLSFNNPGTGLSSAAQERLRDGIDEWLDRTSGESAIDYGVSAVITAQQEDPIADIGHAIHRGVPTLKAFMVYDFGIRPALLRPMLRQVAEAGGMLELHCEDERLLALQIERLIAAGHTRPMDHARSRPTEVEASGTSQAVRWALEDDAPLYVVHLSCAAALEEAAAGRRAGGRIFVETCPHFLALDAENYERPDEEAIRFVVSPPLRQAVDRDALWRGVGNGAVDVVATDHVPDRVDVEKRYRGQLFTEISNGAPGIETLLGVVYSAGVATGRITVDRMVDVLSVTPARLFGLRSKGSLDVGKDADIVMFDPVARRTIEADALHHTSDYTPYEGMVLTGAVRDVLVRGRDVIRDGTFAGRRGAGTYQARSLS